MGSCSFQQFLEPALILDSKSSSPCDETQQSNHIIQPRSHFQNLKFCAYLTGIRSTLNSMNYGQRVSALEVQRIANTICKTAMPGRGPRGGTRILAERLMGPVLQSHWPLRLVDVTKSWNSRFSAIAGLPKIRAFCTPLREAYQGLPYPLSRVYRLSIAEFRFNRGKSVRKGNDGLLMHCKDFVGQAKITSTNLGKIASSTKA